MPIRQLVAILVLSVVAIAESPSVPSNPKAILVLGGGSVNHNVHGTLSATPEGFAFEGKKHKTTVASASIEKVSVGSDVRETGGLPVEAAKLAVPYGGGRVVSLFAHAKYDTLTVEYRDENGGYHGVLFNLPRGQADPLQTAIGTVSAKSHPLAPPAGEKDPKVGWAIQVEPLEPGDSNVSPEFLVATYEHLVDVLTKSGRFAGLLRWGYSIAAKYAHLLILKTDVQKFVRGNEEARAVTTVKGWTKLAVKMRIETAEGKPFLDKNVESNVRWYGNNLRATQTLASSMTNLAGDAGFPQ